MIPFKKQDSLLAKGEKIGKILAFGDDWIKVIILNTSVMLRSEVFSAFAEMVIQGWNSHNPAAPLSNTHSAKNIDIDILELLQEIEQKNQ